MWSVWGWFVVVSNVVSSGPYVVGMLIFYYIPATAAIPASIRKMPAYRPTRN